VDGFKTRHDVDVNSIPYKDKNQTKQHEEQKRKRDEKLTQKRLELEEAAKQSKKQQQLKKASANVRKRHKKEMDWEEWDEIAAEIREMKKEKRAQKRGLTPKA
jgi:uncharacterized protein with ParB-like and HNH nuclease domain